MFKQSHKNTKSTKKILCALCVFVGLPVQKTTVAFKDYGCFLKLSVSLRDKNIRSYTAISCRLYLFLYSMGDRPVVFLNMVRNALVSE